ncbi:MAG: septum formation initiator family protein [Parcubacteria group bacterium]|nr:septum formation initiator family protein [Parcubacteria group bacterium]
MRSIQKKQRFLRLLYSRLSLGVLLLVFLMGLSAVWNVYGKYKDAAEDRFRSKEALAGVEQRIETLKEDVERLKTEEGIEQEFRTTFGFVKRGEGVIVIVDEEGEAGVVKGAGRGFWSNVWEGLKSILRI